MLSTPAQIFVAAVVSTLLYTVQPPYEGLKERGLWTVITCVMVLESSFGATVKKGPLRIFGTGLGGACAALTMAITHAVTGNARWAVINNVPKAITASLILGFCVACLQVARSKDASRDYLYFVAEVTTVLCALMDYYEPTWGFVFQNVFWRAMTISVRTRARARAVSTRPHACALPALQLTGPAPISSQLGVGICGISSLIFFPILSTTQCRKTLAKAVSAAGLVVANVVQGFVSSAQHDAARIKALQAELTKANANLDKIKGWVPIAALESYLVKRPVDEKRWSSALTRLKRVSAVAEGTLHQMARHTPHPASSLPPHAFPLSRPPHARPPPQEVRAEHLDMCDAHRVAIGHAMDQLRVVAYALGAVPTGVEDVSHVVFELGMLQLYVDLLVRAPLIPSSPTDDSSSALSPRLSLTICRQVPLAMAAPSPRVDPASRPLPRAQEDVVEEDQPGRVPGISAGDIQALGHCFFLVSDTLEQFKARGAAALSFSRHFLLYSIFVVMFSVSLCVHLRRQRCVW